MSKGTQWLGRDAGVSFRARRLKGSTDPKDLWYCFFPCKSYFWNSVARHKSTTDVSF